MPAVCSMTGFARADGSGAGSQWTWEARAVNGKGLDIRMRLPAGMEFIEVPAREQIASRIARGNLQISLSVRHEAGAARLVINEQALEDIRTALARVSTEFNVSAGSAENILAIRGVLEAETPSPDAKEREAFGARLLESLGELLHDLVAVREREGATLAGLLRDRLGEIEALVARAEASPARTPEAIRRRLADQIAALTENQAALDEARLHQEAVLLATKADIREELDRLVAHIEAARDLLDKGGPIGRRLDFLAQEFNREVNTLCAKSNDVALTAIGLEMKTSVDQLREQIQNLE